MSIVEIEYARPAGRVTVFRQQIVERTPACIVTYLAHAELERPVRARGAVVLEPGAPVVWFTFPGEWHDIGRFHARDDRFTGYYANVLTPVQFVTPLQWRTTDLFLDVWLDSRGAVLLDEDELHAAELAGALDGALSERARAEADRLLSRARSGAWPPAVCSEFPLERCRQILDTRGTRGGPTV